MRSSTTKRLVRAILVLLFIHPLGHGLSGAERKTDPNSHRAPVDRYGDAVPKRALVRLGTTRFWHGGLINGLAFSPDGRIVASGGGFYSMDTAGNVWYHPTDSIVFWEAKTGRRIRQIDVGQRQVSCLCFSPDGRNLASGCGDAVILWDVATGKERRRFSGHQKIIERVIYYDGGKRLASFERLGPVRLWDPFNGKMLQTCTAWEKKGPPLLLNGYPTEQSLWATLSPNGKTLAWTTWKEENVAGEAYSTKTGAMALRIMNVGTKRCRQVHSQNMELANPVFSPDGRMIATGFENIHLWEAATGKKLAQFDLDSFFPVCVESLGFSPDGRSLFSLHAGSNVCLWDVKKRKPRRLFETSWEGQGVLAPELGSIAFSPDSKTLAAVGNHAVLRLWDVGTGEEKPCLQGHRGPVRRVGFSNNGQTLISTCGRKLVRWRPPTGEGSTLELSAPNPLKLSSVMATSLETATCLTWAENEFVQVQDMAIGKVVSKFQGLIGFSDSIFSPDGKTVLLAEPGTPDGKAIIYDVAKGKAKARIPLTAIASMPVFSPDSKMLAWAGKDGGIYLGEVATGKSWFRFQGVAPTKDDTLTSTYGPLAISADGEYLACVCSHKSGQVSEKNRSRTVICIWHVPTGKETGRLVLPPGKPSWDEVACLAFSPDNRVLATGQLGETTIRLWEVASGQLRGCLRGHQDSVVSLAFSPDGKLLGSGSEDTTVLVWEMNRAIEDRRQLKTNMTALWTELSGDAGQADAALWAFILDPGSAVPFLAKQLRPVPPLDGQQIARFIADLDSRRFAVRQQAARELRALHEWATPFLDKARRGQPSVEVRRRLEQLLEQIRSDRWSPSPDMLRQLRSVEVLEHIGTPQARQILQRIAQGTRGAQLTQQARASLERLAQRKPTMHKPYQAR